LAATAQTVERLSRFLAYLTDEEGAEVDAILAAELPVWVPLPGPQEEAFNCPADILYYGGSAGGGKSDLLLGLALTKHANSIIYRREATQLVGLQTRLLDEILRSRKGWNGQEDTLRLPDRRIEFGSCKDLGNEVKYQGRPHDMIGFDEIPHFLELQFRFLCGWLRTTRGGQRCRIVCAGNPPTNTDGQWVVQYWGPWLDPKHPRPARPGELRWYTTIDGNDVEMEDGTPVLVGGKMVRPLSRTFIPSRVSDNPFLTSTGYEATLQALPEPLRSQMLLGDFRAGMEDDAWQLFPTAWIDAAMERWREDDGRGEMDSAGVDVARGGSDKTVIATRYGHWYAPLRSFPGSQTPDGATAAGLVVSEIRDRAVVHVDGIGVGGEAVGHLQSNGIQTVAVFGNDTETCRNQRDRATNKMKFRNYRALLHWRFREALDPRTGSNIALPPDSELKADLCAVRWKMTGGGVLVEAKEDIKSRIGRSPDRGDAVIYCSMETRKEGGPSKRKAGFSNWSQRGKSREWDGHYQEVTIR